jgi:hypothetical protein
MNVGGSSHGREVLSKEISVKCVKTLISLLAAGSFVACAMQPGARQSPDPEASTGSAAGIEDIYVLRSLREERSAPGDFCAQSKIGFAATREDRYVFKAVVSRPSDGKVVDAISHQAGTLHGCSDSAVPEVNFYAEGVLAGVVATGKGKCTAVASDYPEPGISSLRCFLVLTNLSPPFIGGVLTTNTIVSRQSIGPDSNPPGYVQPSIATIRLWRKRSPL